MEQGTEYYNAGAAIGQLIPLLVQAAQRRKFQAQPLGQVLGFKNVPAAGTGPITPSFTPGMMPRNYNPLSISPTPELVGAGNIPDRPSFPDAPPTAQPLLAQPVSALKNLRTALGDQQLSNVLSSIGLGKRTGVDADAMQLEYDPADGTFKVASGVKNVSSRNANVILRQKDLANKKDLTAWRDAVERRLNKTQVTREEGISLKSDLGLLNFMLSPQFDLLDDVIKNQFQSQSAAAINRLQQRGVTSYTGTRAKQVEGKSAPAIEAPATAKPYNPETRFAEIKAANPGLTDQQIYAQMAIEEASQ